MHDPDIREDIRALGGDIQRVNGDANKSGTSPVNPLSTLKNH